jgi:hypothetical protein
MVTYQEMAELASERIYLACQRFEHGEKRIKAILDPYNEKGSTRRHGTEADRLERAQREEFFLARMRGTGGFASA